MNSVYSANQAISEDRLEFEKFLADLSAKFVALPPEQVDDEIRNALKRILEFFKIDRCALLRLMPGKTLFQITHNADRNGISPFRIEPLYLYRFSHGYALAWLGDMSVNQPGGPLTGRIVSDFTNSSFNIFALNLKWTY